MSVIFSCLSSLWASVLHGRPEHAAFSPPSEKSPDGSLYIDQRIPCLCPSAEIPLLRARQFAGLDLSPSNQRDIQRPQFIRRRPVSFFSVLLGLLLCLKKGAKLFPLLVLAAVLLIFSSIGLRSAFLGIVIAYLVFLSLLAVDSQILSRKKLHYAVLFAGLFLVFLFILLVHQQSSLSKRLGSNITARTACPDVKGLLTSRADLWTVATQMMRDYP